jgi:DNA-binding LacI/PurR family transcriptional regulator
MSQVSITDIAQVAGVSASTVSRALQDNPRISVERRAAIQGIARSMGYRPSQVARSLVTGKTCTLGVVVTDVTDPFVAEVMKGAEAAGRARGYTLLFAMSNHDPEQEMQAYEMLLERQVDGMIVISSRASSRYLELRSGGAIDRDGAIPLVLVNNRLTGPLIYSVCTDHRSGAREVVSYLRQLGHTEIAFLAGPENGRSARERAEGYLDGLQTNGLCPRTELMVPGFGRLDDGTEALRLLLSRRIPPTAVFCYNDLAAIGLLSAAARLGIRVPEDLSVVGYDNISMSAYTTPSLTTVEQPKQQMGRHAVDLCARRLQGEEVSNLVLTGTLVIRESCGPRRDNIRQGGIQE